MPLFCHATCHSQVPFKLFSSSVFVLPFPVVCIHPASPGPRKEKIKEATQSFEKRVGKRRFDEVSSDYNNLESCLWCDVGKPFHATLAWVLAVWVTGVLFWNLGQVVLSKLLCSHCKPRMQWLSSMDGMKLSMESTLMLVLYLGKKISGVSVQPLNHSTPPPLYPFSLPQGCGGGADTRPTFFLEVAKNGDSWLFSKDGALSASSFAMCC